MTWILGNMNKIKFCYNTWMNESPLINKVGTNMKIFINEQATVKNIITTAKSAKSP